MDLTKKQMGTLRKIMRREEKAYDPQKMFCRPGIHPCGLGCLITDGQVSVILNRSPENLPAGGRMDSLARAVSRECGSGSYYLLEAPTLEGDPVELTVTRRGKLQVSGQFDPRCLRDALEIAGSGARLCLGFPPRPSSAPSLLVEPGPKSRERGVLIIRIAALKQPYGQEGTLYEDGFCRAAGCDWEE